MPNKKQDKPTTFDPPETKKYLQEDPDCHCYGRGRLYDEPAYCGADRDDCPKVPHCRTCGGLI